MQRTAELVAFLSKSSTTTTTTTTRRSCSTVLSLGGEACGCVVALSTGPAVGERLQSIHAAVVQACDSVCRRLQAAHWQSGSLAVGLLAATGSLSAILPSR